MLYLFNSHPLSFIIQCILVMSLLSPNENLLLHLVRNCLFFQSSLLPLPSSSHFSSISVPTKPVLNVVSLSNSSRSRKQKNDFPVVIRFPTIDNNCKSTFFLTLVPHFMVDPTPNVSCAALLPLLSFHLNLFLYYSPLSPFSSLKTCSMRHDSSG